MAVAIDATSQFVKDDVNTVASLTTGSFTPPAGSRLWACYAADASTGANTTFSSSPAGLTWNTVAMPQGVGGKAAVAYADVPGGGWTGTVTAACATSWPGALLYVAVVTGGEASPPGGYQKSISASSWPRDTQNSAWTGTNGTDVLTTSNGSIILAICCGWAGTSGGDWFPGTNQTSLGSGFSLSNYQAEVWRYNGTLAIGTYQLYLTSTTFTPSPGPSEAGDMVVIELRGSSGPTVTAELWENGSFKASLGTAQVGADGVLSFTWDAATLTLLSGANVELRLTSDTGMDVGAVEWNAYVDSTYVPPAVTSVEMWGAVAI